MPRAAAGSGFSAAVAKKNGIATKAASGAVGKPLATSSLDDELQQTAKFSSSQWTPSEDELAAAEARCGLLLGGAALPTEIEDAHQVVSMLIDSSQAEGLRIVPLIVRRDKVTLLLTTRSSSSSSSSANSVPPSLIKLGSVASLNGDLKRSSAASSFLSLGPLPRPVTAHVVATDSLSGVRCELPGGCWLLGDGRGGSMASAASSAPPVRTCASLLATSLTTTSASASQAEERTCLTVIRQLLGTDGLAAKVAIGNGGTTVQRVGCHGETGHACRSLADLSYELCGQLLPGPKDARHAKVGATLHAPLLKELEKVVKSPLRRGSDKISWGGCPDWFEASSLSELAVDDGSEPIVEVLRALGQLAAATPSAASVVSKGFGKATADGGWQGDGRRAEGKGGAKGEAQAVGKSDSKLDGAYSWTAGWRQLRVPRVGLDVSTLLVDEAQSVWMGAMEADAMEESGGYDDGAALCAAALIDLPPCTDDEALSELCCAVDAFVPVADAASMPLWEARPAPMVGATPLVRRILKLCNAILLQTLELVGSLITAAAGPPSPGAPPAATPADYHAVNWLLPLLRCCCARLRAPDLSPLRRKLAWHAVLRCADAARSALRQTPPADPRPPPDDGRLKLMCCQPLCVQFDGERTVAYIDVESNLLTSTGGKFSK